MDGLCMQGQLHANPPKGWRAGRVQQRPLAVQVVRMYTPLSPCTGFACSDGQDLNGMGYHV